MVADLYFDGDAFVESSGQDYLSEEDKKFRHELEHAGIDPESEADGVRVYRYAPSAKATARRIENPLSSDSALYLRRWAEDVRAEYKRAAWRHTFFTYLEVA